MSVDVSVAMITYNGGQYIREQLDSILAQTRRPDEIVVVDDGSTDDTLAILSECEAKHPSLFSVYESEENLGVRRNRQRAVEHCTGDVIAFSDQDDIWCEYKIETQLAALERDGIDVTFHNSKIVTNDRDDIGTNWGLCDYTPRTAQKPRAAIEKLLLINYVRGATITLNADVLNWMLPFPEGWAPDYYIAFLAAMFGSLYDIDSNLDCYRRHEDQESEQRVDSTLVTAARRFRTFAPETRKRNAQRWDALIRKAREISEGELALETNEIVALLKRRQRYDTNRATVYDPNRGLVEGYRAVADNWNNGYYARFGHARPILHMSKDALACFVTKVGSA